MASYLDAGSIVALGAGMALFQKEFGLSDAAVGTLAAIGPNAIGCAWPFEVHENPVSGHVSRPAYH